MKELRKYASANPDGYWIVKPGEDSNRGVGITLCENEKELMKLIKTVLSNENIIERNCE
jgi:glutathione synthase/RimK-type ligase-like ATP-grasp enzyme